MNNKSLLKVRYEDALRLLQANEANVQLTISQIFKKPVTNHYKSEENFRSLELYSIISHQDVNADLDQEEDPVLRYFANMKQEQEERADERQRKMNLSGNSLPRVLSPANKSLSLSKSVPDLPKVVAIIPKRAEKPALPKTFGLGRRYTGPVRYPVTPGKDFGGELKYDTTLEVVQSRRQLSLPVDEGRESQVI